jgi:hypothetical protein
MPAGFAGGAYYGLMTAVQLRRQSINFATLLAALIRLKIFELNRLRDRFSSAYKIARWIFFHFPKNRRA